MVHAGRRVLAIAGAGRDRPSFIGAVFFAIDLAGSERLALLATSALFALSIIACAAFLTSMRRVTA